MRGEKKKTDVKHRCEDCLSLMRGYKLYFLWQKQLLLFQAGIVLDKCRNLLLKQQWLIFLATWGQYKKLSEVVYNHF